MVTDLALARDNQNEYMQHRGSGAEASWSLMVRVVRLLKYWGIGVEVVFFCWRVDEFCDDANGILVASGPYGPELSLALFFGDGGLVFVFRLLASGLFG
ncbi:hypothetical protein AgCh_021336 [Apium graveolens]